MTSGYASFDYEILEHRGDLVKLGILVNGEPVDALAMMIHKDFAQKQEERFVKIEKFNPKT